MMGTIHTNSPKYKTKWTVEWIGGNPMFHVYCPGHASRVLLDVTRIEGVYNTPEGPMVLWRCYCGRTGTLLHGVSRSVPSLRDDFPIGAGDPSPVHSRSTLPSPEAA